MPTTISLSMTRKGGFFSKSRDRMIEQAVVEETLEKSKERLMRKGRFGSGGKGKGVQRNTVSSALNPKELTLELLTTTVPPRGPRATAFTRKNVGILRSMIPRVARKTAQRIAAEMS